jgi:integral membrane sensor domain MASE1
MAFKSLPLQAINLALAYAALAWVAMRLTPMGSGFCFIWPSSAVLVTVIASRRRFWAPTIALSMASLALLFVWHGLKWTTCAGMVLADTVEALVAALLMHRLLAPTADAPRAATSPAG